VRAVIAGACAAGALAGCGRLAFDAAGDARSADSIDSVDASTLPSGTVAVVEGETGALVAPFIVKPDPEASNGSFVIDDFFESGHQSLGQVTLQMTIPAAGDFLIWARSRAPDTASDSFLLAIDGGPMLEFDTSLPNTPDPSWHWIAMSETMAPYPPKHVPLSAGAHTLVLRSRETLSTLDQLAIAIAP
jgi:hypothetical protein